MIVDMRQVRVPSTFSAELAVVGAGPAGITTALEAARRGVDVVVVESGHTTFDADAQSLADAAEWDRDLHAPMAVAVRRQIGGTSTIWGGRCVPYDPVDFAERPFVTGSSWPVSYDEVDRHVERACAWMRCGRPAFSLSELPHLPQELVPGLRDGDGVTTSSLERWSLPTDFGKVYLDELRRLPNVRVLTGLTCLQVVTAPESTRAERLECRTQSGVEVAVTAAHFVVAGGGLESTRLLMASRAPAGGQLGNGGDQLGRWYMAHLEGVVADVHFTTPPDATSYDYERDVDGVYVRRRFAFTERFAIEHELPNISGWLANRELPDARHGSPQLSFTYLALTSPLGPRFAPDAQRLSLSGTPIPGTPYGLATISPRAEHVRNVVRHPVETARFVSGFGVKRVLKRGRKAPGFFVHDPANVYPFQYHAEHLPRPDSRVTLSREVDRLGMPKLDIDIRFSQADFDGVVRAHELWDAHLRASGVGRMVYSRDDVAEAVRERSGGGFHQVGTTRMAADSAHGVVDEDLRVYGVENVFVASSSVLVTSGQANSTLVTVALAVRLADTLCRLLGRQASPVAAAGHE